MAAIITSTSTQFTLDHQNWWPHEHIEHDGIHGDKHGHHGHTLGHKHKYGSRNLHPELHEVSIWKRKFQCCKIEIYLQLCQFMYITSR